MTQQEPPGASRVALYRAGADSWRAIDPSFPLWDARCLLAHIEAVGDHYVVLSLVPPLGGVTEVASLSAAEECVEQIRRAA
ncbi:hypothetical protein [Agromyces indicus]|uniref:MbtH-like domain-containing protein n=1 Tax=Agromyces indicus TaxID=758919 RepID=A0ABU1FFY8_9MICO|nr:hypothetical protein [Agromyces indicus]MDR5690664.1 hypothetical protein [Agromyces indicus]